MGKEPVSAGRGGRVKCIRFALRNCRLTASPASANVSRHWALTVSRPFTNLTCIILHVVNLIILRVADLAAAEPRSGVSRHAGVGRVRRRAILNTLRGSVSSCATFNAPAEPGYPRIARFCHKCGKPQREEDIAFAAPPPAPVAPAMSEALHAELAQVQRAARAASIGFRNPLAVRIALLASVLGFLFFGIAGQISALLSLVAMLGAVFSPCSCIVAGQASRFHSPVAFTWAGSPGCFRSLPR